MKLAMDSKLAISDVMLMAMSTAVSAVPRRTSRRLSDFSDIAHLTVTFNGISLTPKQKSWIKCAFDKWKKKSPVSVGDWVHTYIQQRHKDWKNELSKKSHLVQLYSETITKIIEMAIESLDSLDDSLGSLLVSYTSDNGILNGKEGFDLTYWTYVSEALCHLAKEFPVKSNKWETVNGWRIVILFLTNKLEYGFHLEESPKSKSLRYERSFDNPCYME
uniref:Uncharacterized protein n=1 Tax=Acrobeloides nanus TaxID=290746 RepID=A0A914E547_9BILA